MVLGSEHDCCNCSHTPPPHCQSFDFQILVGLSEHSFCVCRLVDSIGEVSGITIAASHEVKRDNGNIMFCNQRQNPHDFYLAATVAVKVEHGIMCSLMFFSKYDCADVTAIVPGDVEINTFEEMIIDHLFSWTYGVDIILVFIGRNDSPPCLLKRFPQLFHQQEIMIKCIVIILFPFITHLPVSVTPSMSAVIQDVWIFEIVQYYASKLIQQQIREEFLDIQYSIMTQVVVAEQQLEFVNIVEVVQTNLAKNFTLLLKRLNHHDTLFAKYEEKMQKDQSEHFTYIQSLQAQVKDQNDLITERLQDIFRKIQSLEENQFSIKQSTDSNGMNVKRLGEEHFNTQLQFEQKMKVKQNELLEIVSHVQLLALEQNRLNDEINKKQNKVEAERIVKETEILKDKNSHIESELKIAHHKIEKMEILNEKAERIQAKKEVEIFKEIEDRVRKEVKNNLTSSIVPGLQNGQPSISSTTNVPKLSAFSPQGVNDVQGMTSQRRSFEAQYYNQNQKRGSIMIDESMMNQGGSGRSDFMRGNVDSYLQKWGEKMKYFEVNLKEVNENLKILNRNNGKKESRENKENSSEGIKDKINQIKPEVVKLWAKLDTIEDRLSFNERKLEEKLRAVTDLTTIIKQNNVSRLEEKQKNLQTEIFTNLKEIKAKLETKVNQTDYDKYCLKMQDRITQINEMIYLKSDKLQVKKALLFLEAKIKEIILVISEDEENEKDALLTKKQLKCISCDKDLDKFSGVVSSPKGNWDGLPFKDHPPEILGRFGMTNFGSLSKKIKKLESKDLPVLNKRNVNQSFQNSS